MFLEEVYSVFLDGMFVGICEDKDYICDIAQDHINGIDVLLDDDIPDRLHYNTIKVNRFYQNGKNICDKFSDQTILCYSYTDAQDGVKKLNKLNIDQEREIAKIKAMTL